MDRNEKLLSQLIGEGLDTPEKQAAAHLVLEQWASKPNLPEGKLMRLLGRNGVSIPDHLVAPLCACGEKMIEWMSKQGADLCATNYAGENGLSLCCMIVDDTKFERAWRMLRKAGVDPLAVDDSLETAMDAAERTGKIEMVERIEESIEAHERAEMLDGTTPGVGKPNRRARL